MVIISASAPACMHSSMVFVLAVCITSYLLGYQHARHGTANHEFGIDERQSDWHGVPACVLNAVVGVRTFARARSAPYQLVRSSAETLCATREGTHQW
jgi:hypothetical protein